MIIIPSGFTKPNNPLIGWHNVVTRTNVSADQETSSAPVTQVANPSTYNPWSGTTAVEQHIQVTLSEAQTLDYVAMARHNLGSAGISYRVEYSSDGAAWTPATASVLPDDNGVIVHVFDEVSAQYWRVRFAAGDEPPELSVLYFGAILQVTRRVYVGHTPITLGRRADVLTGRSEDGNFLGRVVRRRLYQNELSLNNLDPDWYRTNFDPFAEAAEDSPFFLAWRPQTYPDEVAYAWAMQDIVPQNQRNNGMMMVSFPIQAIIGSIAAGTSFQSS